MVDEGREFEQDLLNFLVKHQYITQDKKSWVKKVSLKVEAGERPEVELIFT